MKRLVTALITVFAVFSLASPVIYAQDLFQDVCNGVSDSSVCQEKNKPATTKDNALFGPSGILTKGAQILAIATGVASVIMIIIAGFRYVTSVGDSNTANSAKNTILYAVVGLVIAVLAQSIIIFVLRRI